MPWQLERIALCRQQLLGDRNRSARVDQGEAARSSYSKRKKKKKKRIIIIKNPHRCMYKQIL